MGQPASSRKAAVGTAPHPCIVAINAATVAFVDELLRLPSAGAAATAVNLLYGSDCQPPADVLRHVNGGLHIPLIAMLSSPTPLAVPVAERLRIGGAWRVGGQAAKGARAAARARYRDLASVFVASPRKVAPAAAASLVRYTYGSDGRHWLWSDASARVLHRMVVLNRAVLGWLAALARGEHGLGAGAIDAAIALPDFDLSDEVLDMMAAALPSLAVPVWPRFATALHGSGQPLGGDEATSRYESLFAEILGLTTGAVSETRP